MNASPAAPSGIPDGIELETVYLVEVPYTLEAPGRRPAVRPAHLARIGRLIEQGVLIEAGGCADFSKAVLLVRAASEQAVLDLIDADVYTGAGVWSNPRITPFGRVVPRPTPAAPIEWLEIGSADPARSAAFVAAVFGWSRNADPKASSYERFSVPGSTLGGAFTRDWAPARAPGILPVVTVASIEPLLVSAVAAGGTIETGRTPAPQGGGWWAAIRDPTGILWNVFESDPTVDTGPRHE
jgi:predicted enzyme related to lactoylglutathione lyase/uncharacterized protein YciI